ncbi:hypothetical protein B5S30_g4830 [[Candida] boidinii]|nr:hypothetical protein B5S30_g4830 [[Candida] boidinii]GMG00354.1 unnamed protein product [[Candida] boidinii]
MRPILDTSKIPQESLKELSEIFSKISIENNSQRHLLILQKKISKYLNYLTTFTKLKEITSIERVIWIEEYSDGSDDGNKKLLFESEYDYLELINNYNSIVFLCEDDLKLLDQISVIFKDKFLPHLNDSMNQGKHEIGADNADGNSNGNKVHNVKFSLITTNNYLNHESINLTLENLNLKGDLRYYNWRSFKPILIEDDLVSLELDDCGITEIYKYNSIDQLDKMSNNLIDLIKLSDFKINFINYYVKGSISFNFLNIFKKNYNNYLNNLNNNNFKKLILDQNENLFNDQRSFYYKNCDLIVLERGLDLVPCLLSQLNFSGLCDELIGIDLNTLHYEVEDDEDDDEEGEGEGNQGSSHDEAVTVGGSTEGVNEEEREESTSHVHSNNIKYKQMVLKLNESRDTIYPMIKDLNFAKIGLILNYEAKLLQNEIDKRHGLKDIKEIKKFVSNLSNLNFFKKKLKIYTDLAEIILKNFKINNAFELYNNKLINELNNRFNISIVENNYYNYFIELQQEILNNYFNNDFKLIIEKFKNFIYQFEPKINDSIRLIILLCIIKNGLYLNDYNSIIEILVKFYGIQVLPFLINLKNQKLIFLKTNQDYNLAMLNNSINSIDLSSALTTTDNNNNTSNNNNGNDNNIKPLSLKKNNIQAIQNFNNLNKKFKLLVEDEEDEDDDDEQGVTSPTSSNIDEQVTYPKPLRKIPLVKYKDATFTYPGYVPLFARLVESIYSRDYETGNVNGSNTNGGGYANDSRTNFKIHGWNDLTILKNEDTLQGEFLQEFTLPENKKPLYSTIQLNNSTKSNNNVSSSNIGGGVNEGKNKHSKEETKDLVFIVVIGGLTYAELSSIRFIINNKLKQTSNKQLVILTTGMVNGDKFLNSFK